MTIKQLQEQRANKVTAMRTMVTDSEAAVAAGLAPTLDAAAFEALETEVGELAAQIEREQRLGIMEAQVAAVPPSVGLAQLEGRAEVTLDAGDQPFEHLGEFAVLAYHGIDSDPRMMKHKITAEQRMDTGIKGGYAIPAQHDPQVKALDPAATPLTAMVQMLPAGTPVDAELTFPALNQDGPAPNHQFGGVSVFWEGEGVPAAASDAELREITVKPWGVRGYVPVTDKLMRNWPAAGAWLNGLLGGALNAAKEEAFTEGNGVKKPLGYRHSASTGVYKVNRNTTNTVKLVDLAKMKARALTMGGQKIWLINPSLEEDLIQLANSNGNLIWRETVDSIVAGSPATLMGIPVIMHEFAAAKGSLGDIALVQPMNYIAKPGFGPFIETGKSGTDFEAEKSKVKISQLMGGQPWLTAPYKRRDGTETSPFVLLDVVAS